MSGEIHSREPKVVWRLGPDRVLVRRVDGADGDTHELHGAAALVWIALDEPGTVADVTARMAAAGLVAEPAATAAALRMLVDEHLVSSQAPAG